MYIWRAFDHSFSPLLTLSICLLQRTLVVMVIELLFTLLRFAVASQFAASAADTVIDSVILP